MVSEVQVEDERMVQEFLKEERGGRGPGGGLGGRGGPGGGVGGPEHGPLNESVRGFRTAFARNCSGIVFPAIPQRGTRLTGYPVSPGRWGGGYLRFSL